MRNRQRTIFFTCGLLFGTVHGQQPVDPQAYPVGKIAMLQRELHSVEGKQSLFASGAPNCVVPDGQLEVQKLWIQDQPGGDLTTSLPSGGAATPLDLARDINMRFGSLEGKYPVTILIVDDFRTKLKINGGYGFASITHGQLIKSQIDLALSNLNKPNIKKINTHSLDISDPHFPKTTQALSQRIKNEINKIGKNSHIVVNMSFAVISCRVLDDYNNWRKSQSPKSYQRISFESYVEAVLKSSYSQWTEQSRQDATAAMLTPNGNDPLEPKSSSENNVVWVAAAGNYALHFPLFPAAWSKVVGVAAASNDYSSDAESYVINKNLLTAWSNWGDVKERDQWFKTDLTPKPLYYYGTSFATPLASLLLALSIWQKGQPCILNDYGASPPDSGKPLRDELAKLHCLK